MSKRNLGEKIKLSSYDDMFGTNEDEKKVVVVGDQIKDVALGELHPFKNHPFKVLDDDKMEAAVEPSDLAGTIRAGTVHQEFVTSWN